MSHTTKEVGLDTPIRLHAASKFFPDNPHVNTLRRWAKSGHNGVRLKTFRVGRFAYTTRRKIEEFFDGCTAQYEAELSDTPQDRADEAVLNSLGV